MSNQLERFSQSEDIEGLDDLVPLIHKCRVRPTHPPSDNYIDKKVRGTHPELANRNRKDYNFNMIKNFIHKGLERFYRTGNKSGIQAKHASRLRLILSNLDQAESPEDMDLPGLALHQLKGDRKGVWAVKVSGASHSVSLATMLKSSITKTTTNEVTP
jgi:proteic killer suppression protein